MSSPPWAAPLEALRAASLGCPAFSPGPDPGAAFALPDVVPGAYRLGLGRFRASGRSLPGLRRTGDRPLDDRGADPDADADADAGPDAATRAVPRAATGGIRLRLSVGDSGHRQERACQEEAQRRKCPPRSLAGRPCCQEIHCCPLRPCPSKLGERRHSCVIRIDDDGTLLRRDTDAPSSSEGRVQPGSGSTKMVEDRRAAELGVRSAGTMSENDDLLAAIEAIHAAGLDPEYRPRALGAAADLCGGTLRRSKCSTRSRTAISNSTPLAYRRTRTRLFRSHLALNPRVPHGLRERTGEVAWDYKYFLDEAGMPRPVLCRIPAADRFSLFRFRRVATDASGIRRGRSTALARAWPRQYRRDRLDAAACAAFPAGS